MIEATVLGKLGLAGLIAAGAAGTAWLLLPDAFTRLGPPPATDAAAPAVAKAVPVAAPSAEAPSPGPQPPRFHVARVGARGTLVTAGIAQPGAEVQLLDEGREIGRARADARGEWVILPAEPLAPGPRELALRARSPGGEAVAARDTLLLTVPPPASGQAAGRAEAAGAVAMLLPAAGAAGAAPRLLQAAPEAAAGRPRLALDLVDYDEAGAMHFAGSAAPGSTVRVYVGGGHAGDAVTDAFGRWTLSPAAQPAMGRHILRLDQLAASGAVAARIELPFQRDAAAETLPDGRLVVQPGANLWRIARRVYGRGTRYTTIYRANREQIRDPNLIYPGQLFSLPAEAPAEAVSSRSR